MAKAYDMEIGSFIRFGMENAKRHWLKFFGIIVGSILALLILAFISSKIHSSLAYLLMVIGSIAVSFGIFKNVIRLASHRSFEIKEFIPEGGVFINFLIGMILLQIILGIGYMLLIIPGLILSVMFCMVPYLIVDKKMNFMEAFSESARRTKGHKADIFFGMVVAMIIAQLISLLVITLPFTIPMMAFIYAYPYVQLMGLADGPEDAGQIEGGTIPA